MHEGLRAVGLPEALVNLVSDTTRQSAHELMTANGLVDLLIPRGGAGLIRACVESATVPCIETGTGICHVYVDKDADLDKALNIIENAKTSRPSVCNAEEVAIVHADIAGQFLPMLKKRLVDDRAAAGLPPVELRLDETAQQIISGTPAGETGFRHGISGLYSCRQDRFQRGRGVFPYRRALHAPFRRDHHRKRADRAALYAAS